MLEVGQVLDLTGSFVSQAGYVVCLPEGIPVSDMGYQRQEHVIERGYPVDIKLREHKQFLKTLKEYILEEQSSSQSNLFIVEEENSSETPPRTERGFPGSLNSFVLRQLNDSGFYQSSLPQVRIQYSEDDFEKRMGDGLLEHKWAQRDQETDKIQIRPWIDARHVEYQDRSYQFTKRQP